MFVNLSLILLLFGSKYRLPPKPPHIHPGKQCPKVVPHDDPELFKVAIGGDWYVNQVTATSSEAQQYRCVKAEFVEGNTTNEIAVKLHGLTYYNNTESSQFSMIPNKQGLHGNFNIMPNLQFNDLNATGVISHKTIEKNQYIIMYTCFFLPESKKFCDGAIIFSRQPRLWLRELEDLRKDLNRRQERPVYFRHIFSNVHCEQLDRAIEKQRPRTLQPRKGLQDSEEEDEAPTNVKNQKMSLRPKSLPTTFDCDCELCKNASISIATENRPVPQRPNKARFSSLTKLNIQKTQSSGALSDLRRMVDKYHSARTKAKQRQRGLGPMSPMPVNVIRSGTQDKTTPWPIISNPAYPYAGISRTSGQEKVGKIELFKTSTPAVIRNGGEPFPANTGLDVDHAVKSKEELARKIRRIWEKASGRSATFTGPNSQSRSANSSVALQNENDEKTQKPESNSLSYSRSDSTNTQQARIGNFPSIPFDKNNQMDERESDANREKLTDDKSVPATVLSEQQLPQNSTAARRLRYSFESKPHPGGSSHFYPVAKSSWKKLKFPPLPTLRVVKGKDPFGKNLITATFKDDHEPIRSQAGQRRSTYGMSSPRWMDDRPLSTLKVVKSKDVFGKNIVTTTFKDDYDSEQNLLDGKTMISPYMPPKKSDLATDIMRPLIVKTEHNKPAKNISIFPFQQVSENYVNAKPISSQWGSMTKTVYAPDLTKNIGGKFAEDSNRNALFPHQQMKEDKPSRYPSLSKMVPGSKKKGSYNSQPHTESTKKNFLNPLGNFPYMNSQDDKFWKKGIHKSRLNVPYIDMGSSDDRSTLVVKAKMSYPPGNH